MRFNKQNLILNLGCQANVEITVEAKKEEVTLELLYVLTVEDKLLKIKLSNDSLLETLLMPHPKEILEKPKHMIVNFFILVF